MDLLPILFSIVLVLTGGIIAVCADELGRKLGKKRLSIFGLRPKHTARIGTFLMGMGITIFTIVMVAGLSSGVRQWILEGNKAIAERDDDLRKLGETKFQLQNVQNRYLKDQSQIREFEGQIDLQRRSLTEQRAHVVALSARQTELQGRIDDTNRKYSETQAKLSASQRLFGEDQLRLADANRLLKGSEARTNESLKHSLALRITIQDLQKDITKQTNDLTDLQAQKTDLERQKESLTTDLSTTRMDLSRVYNEVAGERENLVVLQKQEDDARRRAEDRIMQNLVEPSRVKPMIYGIGQEVTRLSISDHLTRDEAENAFDTLIKQARSVAEAKGAHGNPTADIYKHDDISAEQWREKWVDQLTDKGSPEVAIAISYANAFQGEHLALLVDIRENPRVFKNGEIVAESPINGARSLGDIYEALRHFLTNEVQARAKEKKMIPVDADLGAVSADEVLQTVQTIKSANRSVRLEAVAIGDTYAADALKLDLQVR